MAQGILLSASGKPGLVEPGHQLAGLFIPHLPQAHYYGPGARELKCPFQTVDSLAVFHFTQAGLAGGENDQFGAEEIQTRGLESSQETILASRVRLPISLDQKIRSGKSQAAAHKRIFQHLFLVQVQVLTEIAVGAKMQNPGGRSHALEELLTGVAAEEQADLESFPRFQHLGYFLPLLSGLA